MSKLKSKSVKNSFLKDSVSTIKEYNLLESELAELQTTQEIEERVSKSFLPIDAFTPELRSGTGNSGSGTGSGGGW